MPLLHLDDSNKVMATSTTAAGTSPSASTPPELSSFAAAEAQAPRGWTPFDRSLCETLNSKLCLCLVLGDGAGEPGREAHMQLVDEALALLPAAAPAARMPRILFEGASVGQFEHCTAIYGRAPLLAVSDMTVEDKECAYVLDLAPAPLAPLAASDNASPAPSAAPSPQETADFLRRVAAGEEPAAPQGAAPPPGDLMRPRHHVLLLEGRCAVTSTFQRLKRQALQGRGLVRGCVCVYWSERCPCCPAVLLLMDALVGLLGAALEDCAGPTAPRVAYLCCNIDDNELPEFDWPERSEELVVPSVVTYTAMAGAAAAAAASRAVVTQQEGVTRAQYSAERQVPLLLEYLCGQCLAPPAEEPLAALVRERVLRAAADLTMDDVVVSYTATEAERRAGHKKLRSDEDSSHSSSDSDQSTDGDDVDCPPAYARAVRLLDRCAQLDQEQQARRRSPAKGDGALRESLGEAVADALEGLRAAHEEARFFNPKAYYARQTAAATATAPAEGRPGRHAGSSSKEREEDSPSLERKRDNKRNREPSLLS